MATRKMVLGSSRIAWVIVPSAMNFVRSCGMRGVSVSAAVWALKRIGCEGLPIGNGVIETGGMVGGPAIVAVGPRAWALIVVPWGMEAIRTNVSARFGVVFVAGTCIHRPGSK